VDGESSAPFQKLEKRQRQKEMGPGERRWCVVRSHDDPDGGGTGLADSRGARLGEAKHIRRRKVVKLVTRFEQPAGRPRRHTDRGIGIFLEDRDEVGGYGAVGERPESRSDLREKIRR
jgi:hypothetical protein